MKTKQKKIIEIHEEDGYDDYANVLPRETVNELKAILIENKRTIKIKLKDPWNNAK